MTEPAIAPTAVIEPLDLDNLCAGNGRDDQLCDAFAGTHRQKSLAEVDEQDFDLSAIIGVDRSRRVHQAKAFIQRASAAGPHLPFEAGWYFDGDSGRHSSTFEWFEVNRLIDDSKQIQAGRMRGMVTRNFDIPTQPLELDYWYVHDSRVRYG
jgi:hypothetical protein